MVWENGYAETDYLLFYQVYDRMTKKSFLYILFPAGV